MARQVARLIAAALLTAAASLATAADRDRLKTPQIPWSSLAPEERRVLEPVAREWSTMPGYQQQRLQGAARKYPSMQPIQKERFDTRIRDWAAMTPDQRKAARETGCPALSHCMAVLNMRLAAPEAGTNFTARRPEIASS